jgi:hypothetical protein
MTELVEVHTTLSKMVAHPIDTAPLFARALPAPSLPGLLVPAPEDHALLVALHASTHGFAHAPAFVDLELLLRKGLDLDVLVARAREWRLTSVMFAMLTAMRELGSASVSGELLARFEPGALKRNVVAKVATRGASSSGYGWVATQTVLRDDPIAWAAGVGRYVVARARDRGWLGGGARDDAAPRYRVPLWIRTLLAADSAAEHLGNALDSLRDEAILAWVPVEERAALTAAMYTDLTTYLPGGARFRHGLFSWEARVVSQPPFPRQGRLLIGGAGAGRELFALIERGYTAVAFDPCLPFVEAARAIVSPSKAAVLHATYADMVDAADGRGGPLAEACEGRFDAVILGWGSLSHVMPASARLELFRALRRLCPDGPVLASFGLVTDPTMRRGKGRAREALRAAFGALGARGPSEDRDHFQRATGFFAYLNHDEVRRMALDSGYEVLALEEGPYPHAVFVPSKSR